MSTVEIINVESGGATAAVTPASSVSVSADLEVEVIQVSEQGPPGLPGSPGEAGQDGNTILYGGAAPSTAVGQDGDFYINTSTHFIYGPKSFGVWPAGTSLIGPQGAPGVDGVDGVGTPGTAVPLMDGAVTVGTSLAFSR